MSQFNMNKVKAIKKALGSGIKKVGKFLGKQFIEPSKNVNRIRTQKLENMRRQAEAGEFN